METAGERDPVPGLSSAVKLRRAAAPRHLDTLAISYAAAHFGKSLLWFMIELLFGFFLAEIYGIPPRTLGLMLAAFLLWDAITDPLVAIVVARRAVSTQALLKIQFAGALFSSATFWFVFVNPARFGIAPVPYTLAVGIAFRATYSIFDVPQNALLKRLSTTPTRRLTLSSLRTALSALATLAISIASATILSGGIANRGTHFALMAALFAITAIGTAGFLAVEGARCSFDDAHAGMRFGSSLRATLLDRRLAALFLAMFFLSLGWPLFGKLVPFFASYVRHASATTGLYLATMAIAAFTSQPAWMLIGNRVSRRGAIFTAFGVMSAGSFLFLATAQTSTISCLAAITVMSSGASALSLLIWTRLADQLSERALSQASDVLAFGLFTFASKLALSIGGLLLGGTLFVAHYVPGGTMTQADKHALIAQMALYPLMSAMVAALLATVEDKSASNRQIVDQ